MNRTRFKKPKPFTPYSTIEEPNKEGWMYDKMVLDETKIEIYINIYIYASLRKI